MGGIVFVSGPTGSGKTALLREVEQSPELEALEIVEVSCYETSVNDPLAPFREVMRALTQGDRRRTRAKRVLEAIKESRRRWWS